MLIQILAVGSKMPGWVETGFNEYSRRLTRDVRLELVELPLAPRQGSNSMPPAKLNDWEGEKLLAKLDPKATFVALDVKGTQFTTEAFAERLSHWQHTGKPLALAIGGPDGLSKAVLDRAAEKFSLSRLTLPHPLVRIMLAEQIYRAWSYNQGHPYHRA
ncbi:23S rRNA (pseudouridine(1915)-N(3))-methyltransferase RlmH [Allohahella sp. A8]|uniref:23S rRNA (pseudouridine(1915)-N(3))-methyltransferase RlmH n=1 Tax=Allohahella sp. A8 TaxID=3141461 RepID=UPI000C0A6C44|nr:23S rRNA (pseudouridine(1915)-N(3))-methyltransferase RlmH [Hahellaceae bacterium]|tara:strand:+ start:57518 stop:57994 length:477 start_codon:yes stop_codon:yes gene_type:complete